MLFIASKEGQLANRLWHTSSVYANAIEYDYSVAHLYFKEYYPYFSESIEINLNKEKFKFCFLNTSFYSRFFFTFFFFF